MHQLRIKNHVYPHLIQADDHIYVLRDIHL